MKGFHSEREEGVPGDPAAIGRHGERLAKVYLERIGLKFLASNFRTPRGELDLVFRDRDCLIFVEVKTRKAFSWTRPAASVGWKKRRRMTRAIMDYLGRIGRPPVKIRLDIVEVLISDRGSEIRHLPNAIQLAAPCRYG